MIETHARTDSWIQWALLVLTVLGGVWTIGGQIATLEQEIKDHQALFDMQDQRIRALEADVAQLAGSRK